MKTLMKKAVLGMLLGDAALMRDRGSFRLDISHGASQFNYFMWKKKLLQHHGKVQPYKTGFGSKAYRFRYYDKDFLTEIWDICYRDGKKKITESWTKELNDLSLALWYQDDGCFTSIGPKINNIYSERRSFFFTCGFDHESIQVLCDWLTINNLKCKIKIHKKKYEILQLGDCSTRLLWDRVAPFLILKHKIDLGIRPQFFKCSCGRWIRKNRQPCDICCWVEAKQQNAHTNKTRKRGLILNREPSYQQPQITWFDHTKLSQALIDPFPGVDPKASPP